MVKVIDVVPRTNKQGEPFWALQLESGFELVKSHETGRWYACSRKASITSTFSEAHAKSLIGMEIPGSIQRVDCQPYPYTIKDTGEVVTLAHRYEFFREGETVKERVLAEKEVVKPL